VLRLLAPLLMFAVAAVIAHGLWQLDAERRKAAAVGVAAGALVAAGMLMILLGD
jgi:hypothetical protein